MNLEATRDRLEEARFFLRYLDEAQNRPQSQTQTPFRYHLSAFLGATYSVEQYLQTEVVRAMRQQARTRARNCQSSRQGTVIISCSRNGSLPCHKRSKRYGTP